MAFSAPTAKLQTFLLGYSATSVATGLQLVLLPWIAVGLLGIPALELGWVQAAVLLPNLLLLLLGGALADRKDPARVAAVACLGLVLCHSSVAIYFFFQLPSLGLLLIYAMGLGICTAFLQPARDNLVQRCTDGKVPLQGTRVQQTVSWMMLAQYGGQAVGISLASRFDSWGVQSLLLVQICTLTLATICFYHLKNSRPATQSVTKKWPLALTEGFVELKRNRILRELIAIVAFNGFVHIGVFLVVLPLLAENYGRGARYYATLQLAFISGTVIAIVTMLRRGQGQQPGRGILMCMLYSAALLVAISYGPTPFGLMLLCACWGAVAASSASLGRGIVQLLAPEQLRSRIISIYQLALFGSAALGALAAGMVSEYAAPLTTLLWAGILSALAFVAVWFSGTLTKLKINQTNEPKNK